MRKTRRWRRYFFFVWVILLVVDWFLLWSRFYPFEFRGATQKVFEILNFPLSQAYLWVEAKPNPWWNETFGTVFNFVLNDEFGPLLALVIMCFFQVAIYIVLFTGIQKLWRKIEDHRTSPIDRQQGRAA